MDQVAILRDFHLADGEAHYRSLRELLLGHDIVLLHGIHALAHAAAIDEGLAWATVIFDPVLLPTASAPPPGMPNLGPANRRGVVDARSGPGATAAGRRAGACWRAAWAPALRARSPSSTSWPAHHQSSESRRTCRGERMSPARGSTGRRPHRSTDRCRASSRTAHRPSS